MVLHTFAYTHSKTTTAEEEIPVVVDDVLTRTATTRFMIPPGMTKLYWGFASGAFLGEARLLTPSLETRKYRLRIIPRNVTNNNPVNSYGLIFKPSPPVSFVATEELSFLASVTDASTARRIVGVFTLGPDSLPPPPAGEPIWIRCVGSTTLTANAWTTVRLTPEVQLEAGVYSLVNAIGYSANAVAVRFIIPGMVWRPGFLAVQGTTEFSALERANWILNFMPEADYGRFSHLALPEAQFLSTASDTSQVVYLKIIKVA